MKDNDERDLEIIANRKRFMLELRTTKEVQGKGLFYNKADQTYCAVGLYYYVVKGGAELDDNSSSIWHDCKADLSLSICDATKIAVWNNNGSSFAEIADKFEEANFPICRIEDDPLVRLAEFRRRQADIRRETDSYLEELNRLIDATAAAASESREKQAGRITLTQWFEKYGGGSEGDGDERIDGFTKKSLKCLGLKRRQS